MTTRGATFALVACLPALAAALRAPAVVQATQRVGQRPVSTPAAIQPVDLRATSAFASSAVLLLAPLAAAAAEMDSSASNAALARSVVDPMLSIFSLLFLVRIVLSWYPQLLQKMPYKALAVPVEPFLRLLRTVVEPIGGVDITPIVWLALCTFLREILVGPQGILSLMAQQRLG
ncbi:hypothetical protein KFE25_002116 [Diacronema lutheri]|uniref:Fanciful K+ uptake-b family transporter n=1 Tax=Diacronema lutheri TaxID=2081491 RepID=A0A8J5XVR6_DIALT|nr:hypothetical protein KFE25_002116 [Diacronema lutheri]